MQDNFDRGLTLSLDVASLPKGCPNTASEIMFTALDYTFELVDEFSIESSRINKARLDNFLVKLHNNPSAQGYIIEKFARKISQKTIEQKNQKTIDYLKSKSIEKDRIVLLNASADENLTQFILVPPGAYPPSCDNCISVN